MAPSNDPIEFLADRIEKVESRLEHYISENTKRLDTLIELTRNTASIAEKQVRVSEDVAELKAKFGLMDTNTNNSLVRVHERIDKLISDLSTKEELTKERNNIKLEEIKTQLQHQREELQKWLNRGWGAWFISVAAFSVIQYFANATIENYTDQIYELKQSNQQLKTRLADVETQISTILLTVSNNK